MSSEKIVYTAGTWDLFHIGHLNIIKRAKGYGEKLIVGVSTDELVFSYKGKKPFIPFNERIEIIKSIKYVAEVVEQRVVSDIDIMKKYNIDIEVVGDDWKEIYCEGLEWMKENREVIYLSRTDGISSTEIKIRLGREVS